MTKSAHQHQSQRPAHLPHTHLLLRQLCQPVLRLQLLQKITAHDHVYNNSIPCRDPPATSSLIRTDANNLAQSACSDLLNQRISYFKNIHRKLHQHITIGKHQFTLPSAPAPAPAPAAGENNNKSIHFQGIEDAETQSDLCLKIHTRGSENQIRSKITTNLVAEPAAQATNKHFPVQFDGPDSAAPANIIIQSSIAESANIKVNASQSLLFNPQCDHISSSLTNQSAQRLSEASYTMFPKVSPSSDSIGTSNIIIQSSIAESTNIHMYIDLYPSSIPSAPARLMSIHVRTLQFPDTRTLFSSFQIPVQCAIESSYPEFSVPLLMINIDATPDIDPEPPPWITYLCLVFIILVRFRISLWGSNSLSLSSLELSCTHELVTHIFLEHCAVCSTTLTTCLTRCFNSLE